MSSTITPPDSLRRALRGSLVGPEDAAYDEVRGLWNGDIDKRPALIAQCETVEDVVSALAFAREAGFEIAVRGGGHAFSGAGSVTDGFVIDLSRMTSVDVDQEARVARCGGGATMADFDAATQQHGLAVTGGMVSHTGVGGLATGGGYGWLTHHCGLLVDNFVSVEMVLADGSVVRASETENPDLFWAVRGGGGNFGIVTTFEFKLYPIGPEVQVAALFYRKDQVADALVVARETLADLPRDAGGIIVASASEALVPPHVDFPVGPVLVLAGFGDADTHHERVAAAASALEPGFTLATPMPYTALQQINDSAAPWGIHGYSKGSYLDVLSDEAIDVLAEYMPRKQSAMTTVPMFPLGGAYLDYDDDSSALAGARSTRWNVSIDGLTTDPAELPAVREWVRALWNDLQPYASGTGGYINFMAEYEADRIRSSFGSKYPRLAEIKARFDPDNVFRNNANIPPALP